jgi:hypothetical protein
MHRVLEGREPATAGPVGSIALSGLVKNVRLPVHLTTTLDDLYSEVAKHLAGTTFKIVASKKYVLAGLVLSWALEHTAPVRSVYYATRTSPSCPHAPVLAAVLSLRSHVHTARSHQNLGAKSNPCRLKRHAEQGLQGERNGHGRPFSANSCFGGSDG